MADASTTTNPLFELWRKQFEESAAAWARMVGQTQAPPPTDPMAFWRPVLNQGLEQWARLFAHTPVTPDLAVWAALGRRFKVDMFCGVWLDEGNQGLALLPATLQMLGERGVTVNLDIYYEPSDADEGLESE